jgi:hypothetical protein
MDYY